MTSGNFTRQEARYVYETVREACRNLKQAGETITSPNVYAAIRSRHKQLKVEIKLQTVMTTMSHMWCVHDTGKKLKIVNPTGHSWVKIYDFDESGKKRLGV